MPVPIRTDVLHHTAARIHAVQERLGRPLALETPAHYVPIAESEGTTADGLTFLHQVCGSTVLLDVCNLQVSAFNVGEPVADTIDALRPFVDYVHVAGFARGPHFCLDDHGSPPSPLTLQLARSVCAPAVLEWDNEPPTDAEWPDRFRAIERAYVEPACADVVEPSGARPPVSMPSTDFAQWQRDFMAATLRADEPALKPLFAEQVFAALASLTDAFPRTVEGMKDGFRTVVRDFVRVQPAQDVHGHSWIPAFARYLEARFAADPQMHTEWAAHG